MLRRRALGCLPRAALRATVSRTAPSARRLATAAPPSPNDAFANGTNAYYVEEMYRHWRQDPKSVHVSWDVYFSGMDKGIPSQDAFQSPPTFIAQPEGGAPALYAGGGAELDDHLKVTSDILCGTQTMCKHVCHTGPITCQGISSTRSPRRRFGSVGYPRRRP